jgi:CRISPR/Cas system-associated endonuclease Cas1
MKTEDFSKNRKGKREYLNDSLTHGLIKSLNEYFHMKVEIPRIRVGKKQEIETLISEEALLLAMFLRGERKDWIPRIT